MHTLSRVQTLDARDFATVLRIRLAHDPGRPLLTFYDDDTGERVELSVTSFANWVAKTANLITDELMLDPGDTLLVDLPTHWLGPVWLGAAWTAGLEVSFDPTGPADAVVCGPASLERHAPGNAAIPVVACALLPMGVRFAEALPDGVLDYGVLWPGQSDLYAGSGSTPSAGDLAAVAEGQAADLPGEVRLLTDLNPCTEAGRASLLGPLVAGGSTIWVAHPDPGSWSSRATQERATRELRA